MEPCYILESHPAGTYELWRCDSGRETSVFFQIDWDYPGLAQSLGWNMGRQAVPEPDIIPREFRAPDYLKRAWAAEPVCDHDGTDGTVTCPGCGRTAGEFIAAAIEWLDDHLEVEIPESDAPAASEYFRCD